jgi:hypothetical protein
MAINLKTVIFELQFIAELAQDNPHDPRLKDLLTAAKTDLATAAESITGDDIGIGKQTGV